MGRSAHLPAFRSGAPLIIVPLSLGSGAVRLASPGLCTAAPSAPMNFPAGRPGATVFTARRPPESHVISLSAGYACETEPALPPRRAVVATEGREEAMHSGESRRAWNQR